MRGWTRRSRGLYLNEKSEACDPRFRALGVLFCFQYRALISPDAPLELPSFQLTPSQRQVVFQGDSLPFQCQASFVAEDMQVLWYQNGRMVKPDAAQGIFIEKRMVQNCSLIAR